MFTTLRNFAATFIPHCCIICHKRQIDPLCQSCFKELGRFKTKRCIVCANMSLVWVCKACKTQKPYFDETHCVADFESRLQLPIRQLRDHGKLNVLNGLHLTWIKSRSHHYSTAQLIIPAPSSNLSIKKRGFSPSWEIAKQIAKSQKIPCRSDLIAFKSFNCEIPQIRKMRFNFIYEHLAVNHTLLNQLKQSSDRVHITVIDDFMNSGDTLNAVARHLKENGVHWVSNWVLLRTSHAESH